MSALPAIPVDVGVVGVDVVGVDVAKAAAVTAINAGPMTPTR
jgi:hypothetical protein